jgi:alkylhydroperoxidase family enzyme
MAVIHHTTLTPGKLELLAAWLPGEPWYRDGGRAPELTKAGGFRLDDPDGEVGIEFMVVTDAATGTSYHVPLTYRARELPGAAGGLIGTTEHGVLGRRWVYDGVHDPVLVAQLVALIQGDAAPQAQSVSDTVDSTVTSRPATGVPVTVTGAADVASTGEGTELQLGDLVLWIKRVLRPGGEETGPGVSAPWRQPDGTEVGGLFVTAQSQPGGDRPGGLGGRLPLLTPGELDPDQARLRDDLAATRGADATAAGFELELPGGEVIGPFNAYLRVPGIFQVLRDWATAIRHYGLPAEVQQVAILTLGAAWRSDYEVYAHTAEARHAGVPDEAIEAILAGHPPVGLSPEADVAHRLTLALSEDHAVGDDLYAQALDAFGTEKLIALVNLVGRYMNTAAVLACFRVPAPPASQP